MAKVVHFDFEGPVAQNDPDLIQMEMDTMIIESGEQVMTYSLYPGTSVKTILGTYKTATQLNNDLVNDAIEYLDTTYNQNGFDKVFLTGAYSTI